MTEPASAKCSICARPAVAAFKPFCSSRCATLDLGRWLGEGYKIPVADDDPEREDMTPADNADGQL